MNKVQIAHSGLTEAPGYATKSWGTKKQELKYIQLLFFFKNDFVRLP